MKNTLEFGHINLTDEEVDTTSNDYLAVAELLQRIPFQDVMLAMADYALLQSRETETVESRESWERSAKVLYADANLG